MRDDQAENSGANEEPSPSERRVIDRVLGDAANGAVAGEGGRALWQDLSAGGRRLLLPLLTALQAAEGRISPAAVAYTAARLHLSPAEVYGVASFYALLNLEKAPATTLYVCDDVACRLAGAEALCQRLHERLGPEGQVGPGSGRWRRSGCLGHCARAPAVLAQTYGDEFRRTYAPVRSVDEVMDCTGRLVPPSSGGEPAREWFPLADVPQLLTRRFGHPAEAFDIDAYRGGGGFRGLRRALALDPMAVIDEIERAALVGRGGAGFSTAAKWRAVASARQHSRWVVCNADESEPGTFKDRLLLENDPFAVLEGMTIAAWAVGADKGYVFVRGEYPRARRKIEQAVEQAERRGYLGADVLGTGFAFTVEIVSGAGAYVCGEETALFNAVEGKRGEPRNKPPFPTVQGLFGHPTVINNVETLANVPLVLGIGADAYAAVGLPEATGTRLFCVSGQIRRPGLYEVPLGIPLRQLLEWAGGVHPGRRLQAVLLGGAAGSFVGPEGVHLPLAPGPAREQGASLGSGAVVVFDDTADLPAAVERIAKFFREESCGQCVPCRIGTQRQLELVGRLAAGRPWGSLLEEVARHRDLAAVMRDASICGLGQTAANAVESALRLGIFGNGGSADEPIG